MEKKIQELYNQIVEHAYARRNHRIQDNLKYSPFHTLQFNNELQFKEEGVWLVGETKNELVSIAIQPQKKLVEFHIRGTCSVWAMCAYYIWHKEYALDNLDMTQVMRDFEMTYSDTVELRQNLVEKLANYPKDIKPWVYLPTFDISHAKEMTISVTDLYAENISKQIKSVTKAISEWQTLAESADRPNFEAMLGKA